MHNILNLNFAGKWWHGVFTEPSLRKGWFPAQYVEAIDPSAVQSTPQDFGTTTTTSRQPQPPSRPAMPQMQQPPRIQQTQIPMQHAESYESPAPRQLDLHTISPVSKEPPAMKPVKQEKAVKGVIGYLEIQVHGASGLPSDTKAGAFFQHNFFIRFTISSNFNTFRNSASYDCDQRRRQREASQAVQNRNCKERFESLLDGSVSSVRLVLPLELIAKL